MSRISNLAAAALLLATASAPTLAASRASTAEICDYRLDYAVSLQGDMLRLTREGEDIEIHGDRLSIGGETVTLDHAQRKALVRYRESAARLVPQVSELVHESVWLGIEAVELTTRMLAGDDPDEVTLDSERYAALRTALDAHFGHDHLAPGTLGGEDDTQLQARIEEIVAALGRSLGHGVADLVVAALFDADGVEARAARVESEVETRIESRAERLEQGADALCGEVEALDRLEQRIGHFDALRPNGFSI
ncbi:MAG: DUF2884 family protein [Pseudomonadota bacterium]|nr:DUF2884 family protein [Pseudomonadota bacterium]